MIQNYYTTINIKQQAQSINFSIFIDILVLTCDNRKDLKGEIDMELEKAKAIVEAILFACGREVEIKELMSALEVSSEELFAIIQSMKLDYEKEGRGIEIIKVQDAFQLTTKKDFYEYIYPILDKRSKPNLSSAALETLSIIAYNPRITRAEIETIRRCKFRWNYV